MRSSENGAISASGFSISTRQASAEPTSAIAAETALGSGARFAIAACTCGRPVATASTRSASTSSGECSSTQLATSGWSAASARIDRRRRVLAERERLGQRRAHQRRRIVEQHDQRAFGGGAIVGERSE